MPLVLSSVPTDVPTAVPIVAGVYLCPHYSYSLEHDVLLHRVGVFEERGDTKESGVVDPMVPVLLPRLRGLVDNAIGNGIPRRQYVACDFNFLGTLYSVQEAPCGRGKIELKTSMNFLLEKRASKYERDATSAMPLASPAMEVHRRGEVRCVCCLSARARSIDCASFDFLECSL